MPEDYSFSHLGESPSQIAGAIDLPDYLCGRGSTFAGKSRKKGRRFLAR